MSTPELDRKILETFKEFAIDKGLITRLGLSRDDRHIPSYVMDWVVTFAAEQGGNEHGPASRCGRRLHPEAPAIQGRERVD